DERAMLQRPGGEVELHQEEDSSRRTFCPGWSAWTPAVTTTSPGASPFDTTTASGSKRSTSIVRSDTVEVAGSTIHTAGCWLLWVSAVAGMSMVRLGSSSSRPVTVAP